MIAKGKVNASKVQINDRILVAPSLAEGRVRISYTKTGEGVHVARVIGKIKATNWRGYRIQTTSGYFDAEPIETMWLAPGDVAGIKRAHTEALAENIKRNAAVTTERRQAAIERMERENQEQATELTAKDDAAAEKPIARVAIPGTNITAHNLTLEDARNGRTERAERTGSAVVRLLEKVWARIRENHPELPDVVIVTGSGLTPGGGKWGHFRASGWTAKAEEGAATNARMDEMFLAGETLAKGARQVLQTMLHEGAHTLARVREVQDTSRQGRWHNAKFRELAQELGLEHKASSADSTHGYSFVTLTGATVAEYADLLDSLDAEIHLMVSLPGWLPGDQDEDKGGEGMGKRPPVGGGATSSNNLKLTCLCREPNIIRASRKVAELEVIRCDDCEALFRDRG